jgi:hypothetical protein
MIALTLLPRLVALLIVLYSETELFPKGSLIFYMRKNMGWEYTQEEYDTWQLADRGGEQGDYRDGVSAHHSSYQWYRKPLLVGLLIELVNNHILACFLKLCQMQEKIENLIDCLKTEPWSKRGVIPIPYSVIGSQTIDWKDAGQNKCCRELHFYLEDGKLKCTGILRMQNATIFPKNIFFFANLIDHVAKELNVPVGEYTHWITNLCHDRSATSC